MSGSEKVDIQALAQLARIDVSDAEMTKLKEQIPAILSFVRHIREVASGGQPDKNPVHKNVLREDSAPHEAGAFSETLLSAAPRREKNYVKVPQVIKGGKHA